MLKTNILPDPAIRVVRKLFPFISAEMRKCSIFISFEEVHYESSRPLAFNLADMTFII